MPAQHENLPFSQKLSQRIVEIDGLRALAIAGVLLCHLCYGRLEHEKGTSIINSFIKLTQASAIGVDLFFVISGFLIGGILIDNKNSSNYFQTFYVRRAVRIFPIYYALIIFFYLFNLSYSQQWLNIPQWMVQLRFPLKWYLPFLQNFPMAKCGNLGNGMLAATWSLAVEEQFYLILPLIIYFTPRKFLIYIVLLFLIGADLFRAFIWIRSASPISTNMLMPACLDRLSGGLFIAILLRSPKWSRIIEQYKWKIILPSFILIVGIIYVIFFPFTMLFPTLSLAPARILNGPVSSVFWAIFLLFIVTLPPNTLLGKILSNPVLRKIGELSYFVYLFHTPVSYSIRLLLGTFDFLPLGYMWLFETFLTLVVTFLLAAASWRYIERPLIQYGHTFRYNS